MSNKEQLLDKYEELLFADGFDDAIIGVSIGLTNRVVYDTQKMADILVNENNDMDYLSAWEYLAFNTFQAYVGENTPIYVDLSKDEELCYYN